MTTPSLFSRALDLRDAHGPNVARDWLNDRLPPSFRVTSTPWASLDSIPLTYTKGAHQYFFVIDRQGHVKSSPLPAFFGPRWCFRAAVEEMPWTEREVVGPYSDRNDYFRHPDRKDKDDPNREAKPMPRIVTPLDKYTAERGVCPGRSDVLGEWKHQWKAPAVPESVRTAIKSLRAMG